MKYNECVSKEGQYTCKTLTIKTARLPGALENDWLDATVYYPTAEYAKMFVELNRNKISDKSIDYSMGGPEIYTN